MKFSKIFQFYETLNFGVLLALRQSLQLKVRLEVLPYVFHESVVIIVLLFESND